MSGWRAEFGADYAVPPEVSAAGLIDVSWHNDACPSFIRPEDEADFIDGHGQCVARLWVEHPDPDQREYRATKRYSVTIEGGDTPDDGPAFESETDIAGALAALDGGYPDPNDCAECARSYGPHYRGRCEHN